LDFGKLNSSAATEISEYYAHNGSKDTNQVLIHKIPVSIMHRYPKLFSASEVRNYKNLIALSRETVKWQDVIAEAGGQWNYFYRTHPEPSREDVLQAASWIDGVNGAPPLSSK
jgi:hypothetical protein